MDTLTKAAMAKTSAEVHERNNKFLLVVLLILIGLVSATLHMVHLRSYARPEQASSSEMAGASSISENSADPATEFRPTIENHHPGPRPAPEGMVWIPGGEFSMGANDPPDMDEVGMRAIDDARPIHRVYVDGYFMETMDVTNSLFARFVKATGYVTVAERTPRAEDFPGVPRENLVAGGAVFTSTDHAVPLNNYLPEQRRFAFRNSWGKTWGHNGYGMIPIDFFDKFAHFFTRYFL